MKSLTRIGIPTLLLVGLCAFVYAWFSAGGSKEPATGLKSYAKGEMSPLLFMSSPPPLPEDPFLGPDDKDVHFADFEGRVIVVNYWGTFCPPGVAEMPTLADLQSLYDPEELKVLPITVDRVGDYPQARKELSELTGDRLEFFSDPTRGVLFDTGIAGFPTTVVYSRTGKELARYEGEADWISPEAKAFFDAVIAEG